MKKDKILHKIGQLIVPLKRTMSPLEADSHSAPGRHFFNRSLLLLLMMTVGVSEMWGAFTEGLYYIKSNKKTEYYLCPSIGCYYDNNVDQPHLTTFKTNGDQYSIWKIVPTGETDTYYIIHYKTGRYLKSNENFTTVENKQTKNNRKAVHLEVKPATLTDEEDNKFKFLIKNSSSPYQIYPKVYYTTASGMSFNPTNEHQDCYAPADGAVENGGAKGMIGLYSKGDDFSKWQIIPVASASTPCATPIIKYDGGNINISYPYSDETGITIYYTTDGTDPATSGTRSSYSSPISASGVVKVRAIATKTGLVNSDEAVLWGSARPFLIQSKECADYYLVPAGDGTNINTSSLPGTSMQWTLQNAGASTGGVQYYYVVNSNNKKINYNSSDYTLTLNEESADAKKFCVFENGYGTGNFFLIPVSQTDRILYKDKGNVEANNCYAGLNKKWDTNLDQWILRACNETADQKNLFSTAPFSVSNDDETHFYHIASVGQEGYYIVPPAEADGYATTSNTDYDDTPWLFKVAASDNWLTYYYIINAASGKYMYFNPNNNQTGDQENVISLKEISEKNAENEENFQFIMVRSTTTDACYIVPKGYSYADASHMNFYSNKYFGLWANESGPLKSTWSRITTGNHVKWTFAEATITDLYLNPVFSQDESGNITITHPTAACVIHYTIDGTDPSTSSAVYDNTNGLSSTEQCRIKAKAKLKTNSSIVSEVVTLLNMPDITLEVGPYTYKGTAWEPTVTKVSIGTSPNETTAPTEPVSYTASYSGDNINAGTTTATVTLTDADASDLWYIWNASQTFTINPATVTVTAVNKTKSYGDEDPELTATIDGLVPGESESPISYTISREEGNDVGSSYAITPSGEAEQGNYIVTYVSGTLTVTPKAVTVTADNKAKTYGDEDPELTATIDGLVPGESESLISYTISRATGETVDSYTITATGEAAQGNYTVTYPTGTLTISKRPVRIISGITANDKTYDGTTNATLVMTGATFGEGDIITGDDLTIDSATGAFDTKDVGTNKTVTISSLNLVGDDAGNYELASSGNQTTMTASITRAPLSVTANDKIIGYGDAPDNDGVLYVGFVNNETVADLGDDALIYSYNSADNGSGTAYTSTSPVGTYYIIPSGLTSGNYDITFVPGTLTVNPKAIGDGTDPVEGFSISVGIGSENSFVVKNGETTLILGDDYDVNTVSTSGKYSTIQIQGKGNYANQFVIRKAKVDFSNDGQSGTEYSATFVAEGNHALPTAEGITAYIIESISGNEVIATALDYIPDGVPVLLLTDANVEGFVVNTPTSYTAITQEQEEANKLIVASGDDGARTFASTQIYLLYYDEFVLNKAGTLDAGKVYMSNPNYSTPTPSPARLKISRGGNTGIENIEYTIKPQSDAWYTLDGRRLSSKPTKKGIYLQGGKKIVVK